MGAVFPPCKFQVGYSCPVFLCRSSCHACPQSASTWPASPLPSRAPELASPWSASSLPDPVPKLASLQPAPQVVRLGQLRLRPASQSASLKPTETQSTSQTTSQTASSLIHQCSRLPLSPAQRLLNQGCQLWIRMPWVSLHQTRI